MPAGNVPNILEKHWPDYSGDEYSWTAEFVLEQREIKVNESEKKKLF